MSLLLRNELELRLGNRHCQARVRRAGSFGRITAKVECEAQGDAALSEVLARLVASGRPLPRRARLVLSDELVYFNTFAATMSHARAEAEARAYFHNAIGEPQLQVSCHLAPGGYIWLAAAVDGALLAEVEVALGAQGIRLANVQVALLKELRGLANSCTTGCALVGLVREHGIMMVSMQRGSVVDVVWERCDTFHADTVTARVRACLQRQLVHAKGSEGTPAAVEVALYAADPQRQEFLSGTANGMGWSLMPSLASSAWAS